MQKKEAKNKILCIVAGGSGGHITPAIELGKKWKNNNKNGSIIFFGNNKKLDKKIHAKSVLKTSFFKTNLFLLTNLPGKKIWRYPKFLFQLTFTFFKSLFFLYKNRPEKIISTGGLIAIPICLAGKILKIPIELHELNVIPGKAIKFLSPIAKDIFVTFEQSKKFFKGAKLEKYPLRFSPQIKNLSLKKTSNSKKTIFFIGGSQGSLFLNNLLKKIVLEHREIIKNLKIIHQTGQNDKTDWKAFYKKHKISATHFSYSKTMKDWYLLSDLVISRGGAGTLFELEFFKKKSIIIPIKSVASDHQKHNAIAMVERNPKLFTLLDQDLIKKDFNVFLTQLVFNAVSF